MLLHTWYICTLSEKDGKCMSFVVAAKAINCIPFPGAYALMLQGTVKYTCWRSFICRTGLDVFNRERVGVMHSSVGSHATANHDLQQQQKSNWYWKHNDISWQANKRKCPAHHLEHCSSCSVATRSHVRGWLGAQACVCGTVGLWCYCRAFS